MTDLFHLDIIQHPETHLYQSWNPTPHQQLQVLLLFEQSYLVQRDQGELIALYAIKDPAICHKIQAQHKLSEEDLAFLGHLTETTSTDQKTPQRPPQAPPPSISHAAQALSAYQPQRTAGSEVSPQTQPLPHAVLKTVEDTPLHQETLPLLNAALEIAQEQQQALLTTAETLQNNIQKQQVQLQQQLRQMPRLEQELELLNQKLEEWQLVMEAEHHHQETLVHHTQQELCTIQERLQETLSSGMALQNHLRSRRLPEDHQLQRKLNYLEEMIDHVLAQRHSVHYILQQKAYQHLENQRLDLIKARYRGVCEARAQLAQQVEQLEAINRDILHNDPLAVPEPVPVMALHELQRLQFEQEILEADPGLQAYLKSQKETP